MLDRVAVAAYAALLRAFPRRHRARYIDEMVDAFRRELAERHARGGGWGAARFALSALGDAVLAGLSERRRDSRQGGGGASVLLAALRRDVAHAARGLARVWGFSFVCLFSVAVGLGVTLAVLTLFWVTMEPPFELDREGLVEVLSTPRSTWSYPDLADVRAATPSLEWAQWAVGEGTLRSSDTEPGERILLGYVSPGYFETLRIEPMLGRGLPEGGERAGGAVPVVLEWGFWDRTTGADPDVIGRMVAVNRIPHVVVGVAPPWFTFHETRFEVDAWVPLATHPFLAGQAPQRWDRGAEWLRAFMRLPDGTSAGPAQASIRSVMAGLAEAHPSTNAERSARVYPYHWQSAEVVKDARLMEILPGLAGLPLLVVCLNVAGMVLVRSASRERELALRMAIGSSRPRLVRFLMTEALLLAAVGGLLALGALWATLRTLSWRYAVPLPASAEIGSRTVALCMGLSLATTLVFGLLPALRFSRPELFRALRDDAGAGGRRTGRLHRVAASLQTGLALPVLVVAAGVTQGAVSMGGAEFGVRGESLVVWQPTDMAPEGYDEAGTLGLTRSLIEQIGAVAGVEAVAAGDGAPLDGQRASVRVSSPEALGRAIAEVTRVSPGYLEILGVPMLRGRDISPEDERGTQPVAVVTASLAERIFGGERALGRRLAIADPPDDTREYTIVGVAGNVVGAMLESSTDNVFVPLLQEPTTKVALVVRASSAGLAENLVARIRETALGAHPELARPPVSSFATLVEARSDEFPIWVAFFGMIAALMLLLSALGLYGVVAFTVAGRTREIGVRISLGSSRRRVLRMVVRDALKLALPGLVLGAVLSVPAARILDQLYVDIGLPTADARVFAFAASTAMGMVLFASLVPARRAAGVDPIEALRAE